MDKPQQTPVDAGDFFPITREQAKALAHSRDERPQFYLKLITVGGVGKWEPDQP